MNTENEKSPKKSRAEDKATASEPRIKIAPEDEDEEPRATLPDIDPEAVTRLEPNGFAHDTIPAPPLALEEEEEELDTQQT